MKLTTLTTTTTLLISCGKPAERREPKTEMPVATKATVRDVAVSQSHVCAVLSTGQVACWGELQGSLAPLTTTPQILKGVTDAAAISEDDCVLRGAKPAMCWDNQGVVTEVPGTEGAKKIVHEQWDPCFLLASGAVSCWSSRDKKLRAVPGLSKLRSIDNWAYGEWCWVDATGAVKCSGEHADDLGKTLPSYPDAIDVVRVEQDVACVLRQGGVMSCFGRPEGSAGKYPTRADQITDKCVRAGDAVSCFAYSEAASEWTWIPKKLDGKPTDLSCDSNTCCAIIDEGVSCWGDNHNGRLADGMASTAKPTKVAKLAPVAHLLAGERFTVAVTKDGALYAWGSVGGGPHVPQKVTDGPIDLVSLTGSGAIGTHGRTARAYSSDGKHWESQALPELPAVPRALAGVCAALADGTVRCVRENSDGDLRWQSIAGLNDIVQLSGVDSSVCGVSKAGTIACIVDDREDESAPPPSRAELVPGVTKAKRVAIPYVELTDGSVVVVHRDEAKKWTVTPKPELAGISDIASGGYDWSATCGIKDKRAVCWLGFGGGKDDLGLLARSSGVQSGLPAPVEGLGDVRAITAGNSHECAIDLSDIAWCWGDDRDGELGRGRITARDEAARVTF